jgi:hypothetical protein
MIPFWAFNPLISDHWGENPSALADHFSIKRKCPPPDPLPSR